MNSRLTTGVCRVFKGTSPAGRNVRTVAIKCPTPVFFLQPWICQECRYPASFATTKADVTFGRAFSTSKRRREAPSNTPIPPKPLESAKEASIDTTANLPSKSDQRRWKVSRRLAKIMDSILARASVAGHHINIYTGTDYSGIEAIKTAITEQEEKVDASHEKIDSARSLHREAHAKQASSQKEIVSLLERKSSWSPEDLERYMSLVRSEHTDEQAVQAAKDGLDAAERDLENARADLERLERKQYHEEQIWSDTIRRNSTWVTFGLMGLNILLLLTQIAIFEPYRRKKIVREVQRALDETTAAVGTANIEKQIDDVVEPIGIPVEVVEISTPLSELADVALAKQDPLDEVPPENVATASPSARQRTAGRWESYKEKLQDLFSERVVQVKKVDITTTALQGAATGVATMGLLFVLLRPR